MLTKTISHTMDVDVFILSYKRLLFLSEAIKSVLTQTKQPKKITVLDNGSGNDVKQVVEEFLQYGVSWEGAETTHSVHWNFMRAVKKANSKYVLIMHDDDRLCPDFLEKQVEFLEKNQNIIAVGCNGPIINSEGVRTGALILPNEGGNKVYDSSVKVALRYTMGRCLVFASFVYRTDYIKQVRIKKEFDKVADAVLLCDLAGIGPIAHQELPLYEVRVHSGQDSTGLSDYHKQLLNDFFMTIKCKDLQLVRYLQNLIRRRVRREATHQAIVKWWRNIKRDKSLVAVLSGIGLICARNFSVMEATRFVLCEAKHMLVKTIFDKQRLYFSLKFLDAPFKKTSVERKMPDFYSHFINKGDLCFDVGANLGNRTEVFLKLGAKVVCIEPQDSCLQILDRLYGNNNNVIIINKGLAEKEGYLKLHICENATTISTMSDKWVKNGRFSTDYKWTKTQLVPVTTLDDLIKEYGLPKFCKIGVEGFEYPVLKGLTKPIPYISFEFTREFFDDSKKCITHLLSIGRAEFNCSIGESYQLLFPSWITPKELYNKLDSFDENLLWGDIYVKFFD